MLLGALWARADLRRRWASAVLLALLVAVPVGAALALAAGARRAGSSVERFAASTELAEVVVFFTGPADALDELAADPRIVEVDRTRRWPRPRHRWRSAMARYMLLGDDPASPGGFGRPMLIDGRYPTPGSTDEILVNERAAERYGFAVGTRSTLTALASVESFEQVTVGDVEVVGIVRLPFDLVDDPSSEALVLASPGLPVERLPDGATSAPSPCCTSTIPPPPLTSSPTCRHSSRTARSRRPATSFAAPSERPSCSATVCSSPRRPSPSRPCWRSARR